MVHTIKFNIKYSYRNVYFMYTSRYIFAADHELDHIMNPEMAKAELISKTWYYACVSAHVPELHV
jgi:hypothetical protein